MNEQIIVITLALALAVLVLWLLRPRQRSTEATGPTIDRAIESAVPRHYRFFPQIRQALSARDNQYLLEVAPPRIARQVLRERRAVARSFLHGLREDYSSLERLARMVASLSPVVSRQQELERLLLGLRFRLLYSLVQMRLSTGRVPLGQIEQLTALIGRLALRMEQAMAEVGALSADRLTRGLNA
jgi:hypothetical protein